MLYKFDLTADDYIVMNLSSNNTNSVVRARVPYSLLLALAFWILLHDLSDAPTLPSTVAAIALFLGMLAYHGLTWRKNFANTLARYYEDSKRRQILGPHTPRLNARLFRRLPIPLRPSTTA